MLWSKQEVQLSMLSRVAFFAFLCSTALAPCFGQSHDTDSQTLRDILSELRAMHQDMRVTETTQLLVAELELQQGVVNRATENADSARGKLNDIHHDQMQLTADLKKTQDLLDRSTDENERKALSADLDQRTANLSELKVVERDATTTLQDMQQRLQNAQDKLAEIESEMSAAISRLQPLPKDTGQR